MQLNRDQWYVRWFLWNCLVLDRWLRPDETPRRAQRAMERGTDLCTFFRTILLGTLATVVNVGMWLYVAFAFFVLPWILFNVSTVAMTLGFILLVIAAAAVVVVTVFATPEALRWLRRKTSQAVQNAPQRGPGFLQVFGRYLVGIKQRFCPTITIAREKNND